MKVQIAGAGETVIDASRYCVMEHYQEMEAREKRRGCFVQGLSGRSGFPAEILL